MRRWLSYLLVALLGWLVGAAMTSYESSPVSFRDLSSTALAPFATVEPTPDVQATVTVRVRATLTALPKPTVLPQTLVPTRAPTPTRGPSPTPIGPVVFSGSDTANTKAVFLPAGDYAVKWSSKPRNGGNFIADLYSVDGQTDDTLANVILDADTPKSGESNVYGLADGRYYVGVIGDGDWTVTLTPQ